MIALGRNKLLVFLINYILIAWYSYSEIFSSNVLIEHSVLQLKSTLSSLVFLKVSYLAAKEFVICKINNLEGKNLSKMKGDSKLLTNNVYWNLFYNCILTFHKELLY